MGISSAESTDKESCSDRTIVSLEAQHALRELAKDIRILRRRTTFIELALQELCHSFWVLSALSIMLDYGTELAQSPVERGQVWLIVDSRFFHVTEDLL
jgi:hypothetical protein